MHVQDEKARIQHLCWRAGFGPEPALITQWEQKKWAPFFKTIVKEGTQQPRTITVPETENLLKQKGESAQQKKGSPEARKAWRKINVEGIRHLNLAWMDEMTSTDHPFREKMALFWHGHFACRINNVVYQQQLLEVIRQNALGSFRELLFGVSKSPAMLQFLNNQQNRKKHPNENFGREVMELFTLGIGHYTEEDVKQGSRAFTGWGYNTLGEFKFHSHQHDDGVKTFLGKTGHFNGDDILNILLENKATAQYITEKIYRFFVNETVDKAVADDLAEKFYQSDYHIGALMTTIFKSPWFYQEQNTAGNLKSPVELIVGMRRTIPVRFGNERTPLLFQRIMDQVLFYPPNVAGWPGGRCWIDSSTLLFRMRLPQIIYAAHDLNARPKEMPDELSDDYSTRRLRDPFVQGYAKKVEARVDWNRYMQAFHQVADDDLPDAVAEALLVKASRRSNLSLLHQHSDQSSRENRIKSLSILIMSSPEYQLC